MVLDRFFGKPEIAGDLLEGFARVYLSGTNVFQLISNSFTGDDPESSGFGTNDRLRGYYNFGYPYARVFMAGIELTF